MAQIRGTDGNNPLLIGTAGDTYLGGGGEDTYILERGLVQSGETININDDLGSNTIRLTDGLQITGSQVLADQMQLTLSNGTAVFVDGADSFNYDVGGDVAGSNATTQTFDEFVTDTLGASVPADGAGPSSGGAASIGDAAAGNVTVSASNTGPFQADNGDLTFDFEPGNYTAEIQNFGTGDQIDVPSGASPTFPSDADTSDGVKEINLNSEVGTATVRLTGLTPGENGQDGEVFNTQSFTSEFGNDALV